MHRPFSHPGHIAAALAIAVLILLCSCGGKENRLDAEIRKIAENPELQSVQGLDMLSSVILENPEAYKAYIRPDGSIDLKRLGETVERTGKRTDPKFRWNITAYGGVPRGDLRLNLYLERSGSMAGYDARSTSGDFKRTLNELITRFPRVDGIPGSISVVNDAVYPYRGSFEEFVQQKDIFDATDGMGDPSYTDFARIFEYVLRDTVAENINVLVTDLIYSPRDTKGVTPAKIFNEEQSLATSIFQKHADKSVIVVKLEGDFDGLYYPYSTPQSGRRYKGQRPYYAVITGSAAAMYRLRHDSRYANFVDFSSLLGYNAEYIFSREPLILSYYSLLPRGKGMKGSYSLGATQGETGSHALKDIKGDADGIASFRIAANLNGVPASPDYILDTKNYTLTGAPRARILKIEPITEGMIDARTRRFLEPATHLFTVEVDMRHLSPDMEISLSNSLPQWIKASACADDNNTSARNFGNTTFGVDRLLEGIYRAYHGASASPRLFTLRLATQ